MTPIAVGGAVAAPFSLATLFMFFLKVGSVLFGSGYVLLERAFVLALAGGVGLRLGLNSAWLVVGGGLAGYLVLR